MLLAASVLLLAAAAPKTLAQNRSTKRGLVYVTPTALSDNDYWTNKSDDLTWYYNYGVTPTAALDGSNLEFVPMQWGLQDNPETNMTFYNAVKSLQASRSVRYALGFNEPDACWNGSACIDASKAATSWVKQFEPMRTELNITLGGPAVTDGQTGWTWLQQFHSACAQIKGDAKGCDYDFLPMHFYGNFSNFTLHINQVMSTYNNVSSYWVTEFNIDRMNLTESQTFYNESVQLLDGNEKIGRYSMFGAFRSSVSNVGPNGAFLDQKGNLTDIGSWYLGDAATGNIPSMASGTDVHGLGIWVTAAAMFAVGSIF